MFALGFVSVFDQILEGLPEPITQEVFKAYVDALQEDPQQFRRSAPAGAMQPASCMVCTPLSRLPLMGCTFSVSHV